MGLARGARHTGRRVRRSAADLGIAGGSRANRSELERTTGAACRRARAFVGSARRARSGLERAGATPSGTASSPTCPGWAPFLGCATVSRTSQAYDPGGDFVESAGPRLGRASRCSSAAGDSSAVMGRDARAGIVGCAKNGGTRSTGSAVVVGSSCAPGRTSRRPAALERAGPSGGLVSPGSGTRRISGAGRAERDRRDACRGRGRERACSG